MVQYETVKPGNALQHDRHYSFTSTTAMPTMSATHIDVDVDVDVDADADSVQSRGSPGAQRSCVNHMLAHSPIYSEIYLQLANMGEMTTSTCLSRAVLSYHRGCGYALAAHMPRSLALEPFKERQKRRKVGNSRKVGNKYITKSGFIAHKVVLHGVSDGHTCSADKVEVASSPVVPTLAYIHIESNTDVCRTPAPAPGPTPW